jgi:hypothetical protein
MFSVIPNVPHTTLLLCTILPNNQPTTVSIQSFSIRFQIQFNRGNFHLSSSSDSNACIECLQQYLSFSTIGPIYQLGIISMFPWAWVFQIVSEWRISSKNYFGVYSHLCRLMSSQSVPCAAPKDLRSLFSHRCDDKIVDSDLPLVFRHLLIATLDCHERDPQRSPKDPQQGSNYESGRGVRRSVSPTSTQTHRCPQRGGGTVTGAIPHEVPMIPNGVPIRRLGAASGNCHINETIYNTVM